MIGNYDITSFQLKTNLSELSHRSDNDLIVRDSLKHRYKFSKMCITKKFNNFRSEINWPIVLFQIIYLIHFYRI